MEPKAVKLILESVEKFKDDAAQMAGANKTREQAAQQGVCIFCDARCLPGDFRDDESRDEYKISKMCQKCQDEIFSDEDDVEATDGIEMGGGG